MNPREYEIMFGVEDAYWWYRGMRAVARALLPEAFVSRPPFAILDAACGTGANLRHALGERGAPGLFGVGLDLAFGALRFCRDRRLSSLLQASAESIPLRDASFDVVTCHDALGMIRDDAAAARELFRVCRPGGLLYVTAAALRAFRGQHDAAVHTFRRYSRAELIELLTSAGFVVERATYVNALLSPAIFVARRVEGLLGQPASREEARSDFQRSPRVVGRLLYGVLRFEAWIVRRFDLPVGVSLAVRARRPD